MNADYMKNMFLLHCLTKMIFRVCFVFEGFSGLFFFGNFFNFQKYIFHYFDFLQKICDF